MTTLIVPCAGQSSRFPNMKPKFLLTHPDGNLMVQKAIEGINLSDIDKIYIVVLKRHIAEYDAHQILKDAFKSNDKVEILFLNRPTKSQCQTVYEAITIKNIKGKIIIKDSDNKIKLDEIGYENFIVGVDVNNHEIKRLQSKSFLKINNQNIITDIVEKKIVSDTICSGVYGFSDASTFVETFINLKKAITDEIYISYLVSHLILSKTEIFQYIESSYFEDWGTLQDWRIVQNDFKAYFIDFDGVILKNTGKYGTKNWYNTEDVIVDNINAIKKIYDNNAQIIVTTSRTSDFKDNIIRLFNKYDIQLHSVITSLNHSPRVLVNDFASTNPFPSAISISMPRNGNIKDYL